MLEPVGDFVLVTLEPRASMSSLWTPQHNDLARSATVLRSGVYDFSIGESVGCHWTHPKYPQAVVSTVSRPNSPGRFSGYVAVVNFSEIGLFATRQLAQQAVEVLLGEGA